MPYIIKSFKHDYSNETVERSALTYIDNGRESQSVPCLAPHTQGFFEDLKTVLMEINDTVAFQFSTSGSWISLFGLRFLVGVTRNYASTYPFLYLMGEPNWDEGNLKCPVPFDGGENSKSYIYDDEYLWNEYVLGRYASITGPDDREGVSNYTIYCYYNTDFVYLYYKPLETGKMIAPLVSLVKGTTAKGESVVYISTDCNSSGCFALDCKTINSSGNSVNVRNIEITNQTTLKQAWETMGSNTSASHVVTLSNVGRVHGTQLAKNVTEGYVSEPNLSQEYNLSGNDVTYNNTNWLNNNEIDDEIDDFIRNEFIKYFKDILIKLSLIQNLINKNNIVRYLNIPKIENLYSQSILDEKAIKSILKKLIPNPNNISFLLLFSKTKSFQYWLSDVSENLFYLSPYITSDKSITIFLEDGNTYIGTLNKGLFDGFGTLSSLDNKYLYTVFKY